MQHNNPWTTSEYLQNSLSLVPGSLNNKNGSRGSRESDEDRKRKEKKEWSGEDKLTQKDRWNESFDMRPKEMEGMDRGSEEYEA